MRCAVCGVEGAQEWRTAGGTSYGFAHAVGCGVLLWESHWLRVTGGDEAEHAEVLWRWQRRRAEVSGRPCPPAPTSPAEDEINQELEARGLGEVAKELT